MNNITKLELGCGKRPTEGFLHQDLIAFEGIDLDFKCNPWQIPLEQDTLSEVLALGVMEHLRYEDFKKTIIHIYKLLKKGGSFIFDVPDMKIWSEYLYNITHGKSKENPFPDNHIWATIYGWQRWPGDEHKSGWIEEDLIREVENAGYSEIKKGVKVFTKRGFQRGRFNRLGDAHIYLEAIK